MSLSWVGGNTEELHSDVFIPSEHLLLSIIPQAATDQLILALKKNYFPHLQDTFMQEKKLISLNF